MTTFTTAQVLAVSWSSFRCVLTQCYSLRRNGCPIKFTPRTGLGTFREADKKYKNKTRAAAQTLQASVSMSNVKVYDSTIGRVARRKPLPSTKNMATQNVRLLEQCP